MVLLAVLPYANTLRNGFVYDDETQVLRNPYIRDFSHLREIFTTTVWSYVGGKAAESSYYRPLMMVSYLLCYRFFGPRAFVFHLVSLGFHVGVVLLLFLVTEQIFQSAALASLAAGLFALHPIHTEAVDWIAAVTELQLAFFYLLTFWFFLRLPRPGRVRFWLNQMAMAGSFAVAILAKEQAITLPVVATLYEHLYREDRARTTWEEKILRYGVLWALTVAYLLFRMNVLGGIIPTPHRPSTDFPPQLVGLALLGQYVWKLLWPVRLCAYYVFPKDPERLLHWMIGGTVVLGILGLFFVVLWMKEKKSSFGVVWLLVTLAPVLNANWMASNVFTERYLYLPSIGFCWIVAEAGVELWRLTFAPRRLWRGSLAAMGALFAFGCGARIVTRNGVWRDDLSLYRRTVADSPEAYYIHNNLAVVYWQRGDLQAAQKEFQVALRLAPGSETVLNNLGLFALDQKHYQEAQDSFQKALRAAPNYTDAHLNLGKTYRELNMLPQAEQQFAAAVALSPLNPRTRNALGELFLNEGRLQEAEEQFRCSLESRPTREGFWDLGFVYWRRGDRVRAEQALKSANALRPPSSWAHLILGLFYEEGGRVGDAEREFQAGLRIDPGNPRILAALKELASHNSQGKGQPSAADGRRPTVEGQK